MMQWLADALDLQAIILILVLLLAARAFGKMLAGDNPVEAWHFYASRGIDGKQWGDSNKLAKMVFIFSSTLFVGYTFWSQKIDNLYVVGVFAFWAIAMLGIDLFAAWARSFVDRRFGQTPPKEPS